MSLSKKEFNKRMLQPKKKLVPKKERAKCNQCNRPATYSEMVGMRETGNHWCRAHYPSNRKATH